jgi:DNA helicase II / ATP-dependent DNA helicase PcrA
VRDWSSDVCSSDLCLSMAKVLVNPRDGVSFHRAAKLLPGLGDVTIGKIENIAAEKGINLFEACQEMAKLSKGLNVRNSCKKLYDIYNSGLDFSDPAFCMNELIDKFNYKDYMEEKFQKDLVERQDCVQQLIDASGIYNGENGGLSEYLQKISLVTSSDKDSEDDKVSLMSLHAAKGLEFKIVFLIGCEIDILPHRMALMDDPFEGAEEERRVFFVGISRAQKLLYVTYCNNRKRFTKFGMKDIPSKPSPFLKECGLIK